MNISYSGWSKAHGSFSCQVMVDENKTDYEIHFESGRIAYQSSPFESVTADWNHDDDVYTQFGAWFEYRREDGSFDGSQFWTPVDMVRAVADAIDQDTPSYGDCVISIPGIEIPPSAKRLRLEDQIQQSESRAMHQEIERNRKMNALGIRPPGEPWAR